MTALLVALGITVLAMLVLLLWFVPHLLQQQAVRTASESARLREMLLDMLNEQEAVTLRQTQLSTSISCLQDQLEQLVASSARGEVSVPAPGGAFDPEALRNIEAQINTLQGQFQAWYEHRNGVVRARTEQDNESWAYLLSLLSTIQERVGTLSTERTNLAVGVHASALLEELESEMQHLHAISNDISTLQWRLRRSLNERETSISALHTRTSSSVT
jgi:hypothetical protein